MSLSDAADWAQLVGIPLTLIALMVALNGLYRAKQQLDHADKVSQGQFIFTLDQVLISYEDLRTRARYDRSWDYVDQQLTDFQYVHERARIRYYLAVFERLGELLKRGMVDSALVAELYGSRLERLLRKDGVRQIVASKPEEWARLVYLWRELHPKREAMKQLWDKAIKESPPFSQYVDCQTQND